MIGKQTFLSIVLLLVFVSFMISGCEMRDGKRTPNQESETEDSASGSRVDFVTAGLDSRNNDLTIQKNTVFSFKDNDNFAKKIVRLFYKNALIRADENANPKKETKVISTLPGDIKRIKILDDHNIIYLGSTNANDHAKNIVIKNISRGDERIIYSPSDGFLIDEFVLSKDGSLVAAWEVKMEDESDMLIGGYSRIVEIEQSTGRWRVIISEKTTRPESGDELINNQLKLDSSVLIRYPLFYDKKGTLFLDTFGPNGGGWGNGINYVLSGESVVRTLPTLQAGSYSFDPVISSSGSFFAVVMPRQKYSADREGVSMAQQDGSKISFFQDLNEVGSLQAPAEVIITSQPIFSLDDKYIAYNGVDEGGHASYVANIKTGETNKYETGEMDIVEFTSDNKLILGERDQSSYSNEGSAGSPLVSNLGPKYSFLFSKYKVVDVTSGKKASISEFDGSAPAEHVHELWKLETDLVGSVKPSGENNLRIDYLIPRNVELPQNRLTSQSKPTADPGTPAVIDNPKGLPKCNDILNTRMHKLLEKKMKKNKTSTVSVSENEVPPIDYSKCFDSPLYLYPNFENEIVIKTDNTTFGENPMMSEGEWRVTSSPEGTIKDSSGKIYDKISYGYISDSPNKMPDYSGVLAGQNNLNKTLYSYAVKLGLNKKETSDFVVFWDNQLRGKSPFIQISHFSREKSAEILKIKIEPEPDKFVPIVMYFKKLYFPIILREPNFEPIPPRDGFFVLDWSGAIE